MADEPKKPREVRTDDDPELKLDTAGMEPPAKKPAREVRRG